jgi:hypothetical protein
LNVWIKKKTPLLALILACAVTLGACTQSPAPETDAPPAPESPSPTDTATLIPSPTEDVPEETPEPTPEPTPVPWPVNADIGLSVTTWNESVSEGGVLCLSAEASLPSFSGAPDAVIGYYTAAMEDFQRRAQGYADEAKAMRRDGALTRPYAFSQNFVVECNAARIISVRRIEELDMGGMHAETVVYGNNFSADTGKLLGLDDFFAVTRDEYMPVLLAEVIAQLGQNPNDLFEDWRETAEESLAFASSADFCVTPDGLSLFFPELSLAPYALGVIRVDAPWGALEGLWKLPE